MKKGDIEILTNLINALEIAEQRLEEAYKKKDYEAFNKTRAYILEVQKRIGEMTK